MKKQPTPTTEQLEKHFAALNRCENCGMQDHRLYKGWCLDCRFGDDP